MGECCSKSHPQAERDFRHLGLALEYAMKYETTSGYFLSRFVENYLYLHDSILEFHIVLAQMNWSSHVALQLWKSVTQTQLMMICSLDKWAQKGDFPTQLSDLCVKENEMLQNAAAHVGCATQVILLITEANDHFLNNHGGYIEKRASELFEK